MSYCWCAITVVLLAVAGPVYPQAVTDPGSEIPIDSRVVTGTLDNGLRYFIRANERPENRAELRLVVNAGSVLEDDDQRGLAHFVEHMAFNGTRNFERQELVQYLESIGMRFGPDLNAYTSFDETVYMLTVPTDREDVISTAFQILADWAGGVTFDPDEIDKERGVVIEEWRGRLGAQSRLTDQQIPVLLRDSRYAERLPIGQVEVLESFPHAALVRFYERWYRPDLMAVVAVGDFDAEEIEGLVRERFASLSPPDEALDRNLFEVPGHAETLFHVATDPELTTTRVEIRVKLPARETRTVGDQRQLLVERLYTSMLNARFAEITQRPDAPFLAASSGRGGFVRTADMYSLVALVAEDGVERGLEALQMEAERVARHGFTETELDRTRVNLLRSLERSYAERERTNSGVYANQYVNHFLTGAPIPGIAFDYAIAQELLPGITVEEVNIVAREWATEENRVVLVSAPEKEDLVMPTVAALRGVLESVASAEVEPYVDDVPDQPLLAELPTAGAVVEERRHEAVDVVEWRLQNGVRVLLKPTDFRDDEILFRGYSPGGLSLASDDEYLSASFATDVVRSSGLGPFNAVALGRVLTGKAAAVSPFIGDLEHGLSGSASPSDLETLFELAYLYFTGPRHDPEPVSALMEQLRVLLANRAADPNAAFSDTLQAVLTQNHPRAQPLTAERLESVDPERAFEFYNERFADATGFTFVIVGNVDPDRVRPLVERYLGGLPADGDRQEWRDTGIRPPTGVVERVVRRGLEPRATTRLFFTGPLEYSREASHLIRSLASVLDIRLREVLREDLGATYGVQVSGSASRRPEERYMVEIGFSTSPERLDDLTHALFAEIESLAGEGPRAEDLARVQEIQRRERETSLRQNGFWISQISAYDREEFDLAGILDGERFTGELTTERIRQAARDWLDPERYVQISLLPADGQ